MRTVYVCLGCSCLYLPPESMTYPSHPDLTASRTHCGQPGCEEKARTAVATSGLPEERVVELARRAAGLDVPAPERRPWRLARGRRPAAAPRGARGRLS
ncbi:hypothetical protein ABZX40_13410 [Streptomyces sp. NPDC004610]|uniref:hypothetical protein n=1 Tax=unclassified Streptomyces TaxID=2593676 RepID=UPI0033BDE836